MRLMFINLTIRSVKSSNAIEGIVTSDERISQIVQQNSAPLNHNEMEISGYRDTLNLIHLLPDISPTTVEAVLGKMIKSGLVTTVGAGRGTKYIKS